MNNGKLLSILGLAASILVVFVLLSFMQKPNKLASTSIQVPEILQRSDRIQNGKEWDQIQNAYTHNKNLFTKDQKDYESALNLAYIYIKEARVTGEHGHYYPSALKMIDVILKQEEIDKDLKFRARTTKAGVLLSLHEFEAAKAEGEMALELNPNNAQVYGVLVDANIELGNYSKAVELSEKMINIKPDLRSYARISYLREIHGDVKGAKQAMEMAVRAGYPGTEDTAWAMLTLAELYQRYGDLENAKKVYEQTIKLRSDYPFAIGGLGEIAYENKEYKLAESTIQNAMDIIPEVGFYIQMAQLYKDQNRTEEFDAMMSDILVMLKDDTDSGHNMNLEYANIYLNLLDDTEKAYKYASIEYQKRPLNIDVNLMMAEIEYANNNIAKSKEHTIKAFKTNTKNPDLVSLSEKLFS